MGAEEHRKHFDSFDLFDGFVSQSFLETLRGLPRSTKTNPNTAGINVSSLHVSVLEYFRYADTEITEF